ncbi:hypothetical protein [Chryseobacterium lactis]|uniref:hypothetical protein n=1 Tax=Chryseobacterium lactis TaxID=1241981 RepID=UPI001624C883|nr:hypothetical protein [Chryseobacterium lactis]
MKSVIYFLIVLLSLVSCENEDRIKMNLEEYSLSVFERRKIDTVGFKKEYYIKENKSVPYKHYVLKYYKTIGKDSVIIWFTRDDKADYFIEENHNYYKYIKKREH